MTRLPKSRFARLVVAVGLLALAACNGPQGQWTLDQIDGKPVRSLRPLTARFANGQVSGSAGCNSFHGRFTALGSSLHVPRLSQTLMLCLPLEITKTEDAYMRALTSSQKFEVSKDGRLRIEGAGHILVFHHTPTR